MITGILWKTKTGKTFWQTSFVETVWEYGDLEVNVSNEPLLSGLIMDPEVSEIWEKKINFENTRYFNLIKEEESNIDIPSKYMERIAKICDNDIDLYIEEDEVFGTCELCEHIDDAYYYSTGEGIKKVELKGDKND